MIKGCIVITEADEAGLYPLHADTFAAYYQMVTGQAVPADMSATERRAFVVARAMMEET